MSDFVARKRGEMAASQSRGGDAVEFVQERSFESMERHDNDALEVRSLVSETQQQPPLSRLQKRAPAKMQLITLSPDSMGLSCRSPIPLLSPILVSPLGGGDLDRLLFNEEAGKQNPEEEARVVNAVIPTNGWQHPAAPFFAERVVSFSVRSPIFL
jgi:hypothetical protein